MKERSCEWHLYFDIQKNDIIFFSRAKTNEKHSILSPFDITSRLLGPYLFSATSRETLGDKMEYYFQDHSFVPLFIQVFMTDVVVLKTR